MRSRCPIGTVSSWAVDLRGAGIIAGVKQSSGGGGDENEVALKWTRTSVLAVVGASAGGRVRSLVDETLDLIRS